MEIKSASPHLLMFRKATEYLKTTGWELLDFGIYRIYTNEYDGGSDKGMIYVQISGPQPDKHPGDNAGVYVALVDPAVANATIPMTFLEKDWDLFVAMMSRFAEFNRFMDED